MTTSKKSGRWAVLVHQLPVTPSSVRVTIWRRLRQIGAVALRNSVYVLPNTAEAREDFEWLRSEIVGLGGSATIMAADMVSPYTSEELVEQFRKQRSHDYAELTREVEKVLGRRRAGKRPVPRATIQRQVQALRERYTRIHSTDYFSADNATRAAEAVGELEQASATRRTRQSASATVTATRNYRAKIWVTRTRPGVDRMASAWFIRKYVDPAARFSFIPSEARVPSGRVPFDMYGVEIGHHGAHCTLETLMEMFTVRDPATVRLSQVVHDLDLKDAHYALPECAAVGRVIDGLRQLYADDHALLNQGIVLMEALYRSFAGDRPKSESRRRGSRPAPVTNRRERGRP